MRENPFHRYLNENPHWDLFYRLILWMLIGLTTSLIALYGKDSDSIKRYTDIIGITSVRSLNNLGIFGIALTTAALLFKNLEITGGDKWRSSNLLCMAGHFIRRTANDILISVFGLGSTILGVMLTLAILLEGTKRDWMVFGITIAEFSIIVGFIGFLNAMIRAEKNSPIIIWQKYLNPPRAVIFYIGIATLLTFNIVK